MAFTAGSPELARANKLGNILGHLYAAHGVNMSGRTGAMTFERQAKKLGFGITGLTTGNGFPPFGTMPVSLALTSSLQNPRGETASGGIGLGTVDGQTLGIYLPKFVRSGADFDVVTYSGLTLWASVTAGDSGLTANGGAGGLTLTYLDRLVFAPGQYITVGLQGGGAAAGKSGAVPIAGTSPYSFPAGSVFYVEIVGVTRGTRVAGTTFENYAAVPGLGYTATIYYNSTTAAGHTWSVN